MQSGEERPVNRCIEPRWLFHHLTGRYLASRAGGQEHQIYPAHPARCDTVLVAASSAMNGTMRGRHISHLVLRWRLPALAVERKADRVATGCDEQRRAGVDNHRASVLPQSSASKSLPGKAQAGAVSGGTVGPVIWTARGTAGRSCATPLKRRNLAGTSGIRHSPLGWWWRPLSGTMDAEHKKGYRRPVAALCGGRPKRGEKWELEPLDAGQEPCPECTCTQCQYEYAAATAAQG